MSDAITPTINVLDAWEQLVRAQRDLVGRVEEDLKKAGFPPLEWYDVLWALDRAEAGWLRQTDVNRRVLLAPYNLSRLIDRLEQEGLAKRQQCPRDGRNNVLLITDKGRDLRRQMWPVYAGALHRHFGTRLTEAEARHLSDLLARLDPGITSSD